MPGTGYVVIVGKGRKGNGLFATRGFVQGAALYQFDYWSQPIMPIHSTNHSCDPNAAFDQDGMLCAVRAIAPHEEITFDYLLFPIPASPWNFECACESLNCKGWIDAAGEQETMRQLADDAELALNEAAPFD